MQVVGELDGAVVSVGLGATGTAIAIFDSSRSTTADKVARMVVFIWFSP